MAQESAGPTGPDATDRQPSSPASTSSREDTRDARERLKKTSIAGLQKASNVPSPKAGDASDLPADTNNGSRGRPSKKRSFEDLAKDNVDADAAYSVMPEPKRSDHKRVRSADVNSGEHTQAHSRIEADKSATVHEEEDAHEEPGVEAQTSPGGPGILVEAPSQEEMAASSSALKPATAETVSNPPSTAASTQTKIPHTSGFANSSTTSPFGQPPASASTDSVSTPDATATTASAFSSSGLAAFASLEKSPFGAASTSKSPLGGRTGFTGGASTGFGAGTGFASTTTSSFARAPTAFGSAKPFGGPSAFGVPKPFGAAAAFGSGGSSFGASKPIGASTRQDDDDEEGDEDDDENPTSPEDTQQDPRFHEQHVDTGEEGELVQFSSRARLYFFDGAWKERGTGVFKVNVRMADLGPSSTAALDPDARPSSAKRKARLLMRADATHRVILNSPIFKGMRFGQSDGSKPTGKIMHIQSLENGKPVPLQIKIGKEDVLEELYDTLVELEAEA